jgi:hypothetical protein
MGHSCDPTRRRLTEIPATWSEYHLKDLVFDQIVSRIIDSGRTALDETPSIRLVTQAGLKSRAVFSWLSLMSFLAVGITLVGEADVQFGEGSRLQKASHWPFSLR